MNSRLMARVILEKVASRTQENNQVEGLLKEAYLQGVSDGMEKVSKRTLGDVIGDTDVQWWKTPAFHNQRNDVGRIVGAGQAAGEDLPFKLKPFAAPMVYGGAGSLAGGVVGSVLGKAFADEGTKAGVIGTAVGGMAGLITLAIHRASKAREMKERLMDVEITDRVKERAEEKARDVVDATDIINPFVPGAWTRGRTEALENIRHGKDPMKGRGYLADAATYAGPALGVPVGVGVELYDRAKALMSLQKASPISHRVARGLSETVSDAKSGWESGKR